MRVVAFTPLYPPKSRVGAWLATHAHLRTLVRIGHDVSVRVALGSGESYTLDGIDVAPTGWDFTPHAEGADVALSHNGDIYDRQIRFAVNEARAAHVVMVHGPTDTAPDADLVVFNSHASRDACGQPARSIMCHPPLTRTAHETIRGDHATLVNLSKAKGAELFRVLCSAMPERPFLGVKGGYGRQVRPYGPNARVMNTTTDMRDVWSQTRVLLMPSEVETWGMAGVEAMCSGIPVIAHPTEGLRESLGGAGTFVDRSDLGGWIEAIRSLDDPKLYAERSQLAIQRARELSAPSDTFAQSIESLMREKVG